MSSKRLFLVISALICSIAPVEQTAANLPPGAPLENPNPARDCLGPALARSRRHVALQGETVESIARQYKVPTAALIGINPMLRGDRISAGSAIVIPPYDGRLLTNLCLKARGFLLRRDSDEFTLGKHLDRMPYGCKSSN